MQTIYLDVSNKGVIPTIYVKQGDIGRQFTAVINDNGVPFSIPEDAEVLVWYEAKNNAGNYNSVEVNENRVIVTIDQKSTLTPGNGIMCLSVSYSTGEEISTWNIPYDVEIKPGTNPIYPDVPSPGVGSGAVFIPHVSDEGVISWTNNGNYPNPEPVNIKGKDGVDGKDGQNGIDGQPGSDGYTPVKGTDYWTEADRKQMVTDVIAALPVYNGEVV